MGKRTNVNVRFHTVQDTPPGTSQESYLPVLAPRCTSIEYVLCISKKERCLTECQSILIRMCLLKQAHETIRSVGGGAKR